MSTVSKESALDLSDVFGGDITADDFSTTGGLMPTYKPEVNSDQVIRGYAIGIVPMPDVKKDNNRPWNAAIILLAVPCTVSKGTGDNAELYNADKGEQILLPINGSLENNSDFLKYAADPRSVYPMQIRVRGQIATGKPSKMWDYEVLVSKKKGVVDRSKSPEFALPTPMRTSKSLPPGNSAGASA